MDKQIASPETMEAYCHTLFDSAHEKWTQHGGSTLAAREKLILSVETFYGEVMNGGFEQYLSNESGAFVNWAPEGFRTIGLPEFATFVSRIIALFPTGRISDDEDERFDQIDEIDEAALDAIEEEFWEFYDDDKMIRVKLYEYLQKNK